MKKAMSGVLVALLSTVLIASDGQSHKVPQGGPCCLCECRAANQNACSTLCIRLQHGKKVVEEPMIHVCTRTCRRVHVVTLPEGAVVRAGGGTA